MPSFLLGCKATYHQGAARVSFERLLHIIASEAQDLDLVHRIEKRLCTELAAARIRIPHRPAASPPAPMPSRATIDKALAAEAHHLERTAKRLGITRERLAAELLKRQTRPHPGTRAIR